MVLKVIVFIVVLFILDKLFKRGFEYIRSRKLKDAKE